MKLLAISVFLDIRFISVLLLVMGLSSPGKAEIVHLDSGNIDEVLNNAGVALVNFYADWCRFSQMLHPIFEEASNIVREEFPSTHQVVFARVDCDQHSDIAQRYRINKYPTLKLFRNGMMMKREYRGQRSVVAIADFIRQQQVDPVKELLTMEEANTVDRSKRNIIGYFETKDSDNYHAYEKVANILRDDCTFSAAFGPASESERVGGDNMIYKPVGENVPDMVYLGSLASFDLAYAWAQDKCVPLVREITFENGEELTEEGLPFLILFHINDDTESLEKFQQEVARQLISEKGTINFLHADCEKFRHPLLHIQKSPTDCPVIAIDSFRHMYVFPDFKDLNIPGKLKQFVLDLHSGKLHREFHHGPDPTNSTPGQEENEVASSPPKSSFQKLAPSETRYTILSRDRDEL
ncbi:endoplasmic reticulum resident protein 44 [Takifugu rubripes]|uniref:endoplasmic reticulum resident protein 44 n=1 Tax=Takifugu rubripes TaxID=31033 RepID=UPI0005D144B1|nr:endoplasmic reticulum resident protein 44 [Takifugu rubripes]|eukprot:XP_011603971.1 PREDICTED: endoplasmic reticulum resident protein 44 [Takifugu rubripes]